MNAATSHNIIVDCLISHSDWIFPGGKNEIQWVLSVTTFRNGILGKMS